MDPGLLFLCAVALILGAILLLREPARLKEALGLSCGYGQRLIFRVPLLFFAATFLGQLVPPDVVGPLLSAQSGWRGIVIAAAVGAVMPGGAAVAFPAALVLWQLGTGPAQMTALLTSWSVFAAHRLIVYELPMMGRRFVMLRLCSVWYAPFLTGALAASVLALLDATAPVR